MNNKQILPINEVIKDFTKAVTTAIEFGTVIISEDNLPKYALINMENSPILDLTDDEKIEIVAKRILEKYRLAFEELAK